MTVNDADYVASNESSLNKYFGRVVKKRSMPKMLNVDLIKSYSMKAIPFQAWTGPEGSRRLRHSDIETIGT